MQSVPGSSGIAAPARELTMSAARVEPLFAGAVETSVSSDAASASGIYRRPVVIACAFGLVGLALLLFGMKTPWMM